MECLLRQTGDLLCLLALDSLKEQIVLSHLFNHHCQIIKKIGRLVTFFLLLVSLWKYKLFFYKKNTADAHKYTHLYEYSHVTLHL